MAEIRKGDQVEILKGKRQGQVAKVTEISEGNRILVQVEGVPYESSYLRTDVRMKVKASQMEPLEGKFLHSPYLALNDVHGERKQQIIQRLVKDRKICPSYPYMCTGSCEVAANVEH